MKPYLITLTLLPLLFIACNAVKETSTPVSEATRTPEPSPTVTSIPFENVNFITEDKVTLAGTLFGNGKIAVILAHQGTPRADQTTWQPFAQMLAERGYSALTFDFRGVGQSEGVLGYGDLRKDVKAAAQFLRGRGYSQIVCVGASMGGTACIYNAARDEYMGLIVLASTMMAGRGIDTLTITDEDLAKLTLPKLFITAERDNYSVVRDTKRMAELSPNPKAFILLPGARHGTDLFNTDSGEKLTASMLEFLDNLPNQTITPVLPTPSATPIVLESGRESGSDVAITFIRNEGFLFASAQGEKVMIDSLFIGLPEYGIVTPEQRQLMENALPPFDNVDVILITHGHQDHFDFEIVRNYLVHSPQTILISTADVAAMFEGLFPDRIRAVEITAGETESLTVNGFEVDALGLLHSAPHGKYPHLGFVFTIGGKRILHMGDADQLPENLVLEELDVVFIEPWVVSPPAKHIIKMHYNIPSPYADLQQWIIR